MSACSVTTSLSAQRACNRELVSSRQRSSVHTATAARRRATHRHPQQQRLQPCRVTPFDQAWGTTLNVDSLIDTLPQNLFALSLFPYIGFLYHLHRSKQAPPLTLFGFYFLLAFVFATIPAGIYAKQVYGLALANVDWLHGSAEFLLTLTNLFIVLGLRDAIRKAEAANAAKEAAAASSSSAEVEKQPVAAQD
ncbi:hypothetical protein D9Q98_000577 [Chlorella vulgaris]|uniref:Uncharacterized protein n=1 Tax=Chlorella vulgaris TaxID=3077 RepID=A0A9D4TZG8_CHLVU|nr:hypothetical protein D9Q98_000577 [Chlorella vulgaris]